MKNSSSLLIKNALVTAGVICYTGATGQKPDHPNIVLIVTDDQGYGDFGFTGNPHVKTPVLDNLARESIRFTNFYVCPVSAPTRAGLMTGRYPLRTGVRDTYNGGAMMASSEVTIAEMLKQAGYTTGIFGKWHLGDNYPMRPNDQGFNESVIHLAGGMGQPGDFTTWPRRDSSYFDPVLWHNGNMQKYKGYCSDIFAGEAIRFIERNKDRPFFCYLAFNAPHTPLQVPEEYYDLYKNTDPSKGLENDTGMFPEMSEKDKEDTRKVYAMVTNIDVNMGRILKKLEDLRMAENTVLIFMTDNGPQQKRYNAGMRGLKSSVYRGGIRVPCWIRYPAMKTGNADITTTAANIDLLPTLADLCHAEIPAGRKIDGISLLPDMKGERSDESSRSLFFYWTRHSPELYNNMALQKGRYKLIGNTGFNAPVDAFQLYDLGNDPFEQHNIVNVHPDRAAELKEELDGIFRELAGSENLIVRPRIEVGTRLENPVILNRNDADGQWGIWEQEEVFGFWRLKIHEGRYTLRFKFINPLPEGGKMMVETGVFITQTQIGMGSSDFIEMKDVRLPGLICDFVPFYLSGSKRIFPLWVEMERTDLAH